MTDVTGSDNTLYDFPPGTTCFADLADGMSFNRASILKSVLRWGEKDGTTLEYDLCKIQWYAGRQLRLLQAAQGANADAPEELDTNPEGSGSGEGVGVRTMPQEKTGGEV